jgi:hypothetical protein
MQGGIGHGAYIVRLVVETVSASVSFHNVSIMYIITTTTNCN